MDKSSLVGAASYQTARVLLFHAFLAVRLYTSGAYARVTRFPALAGGSSESATHL